VKRCTLGEAENFIRSEEKGLSPEGEEETHCEAMQVAFTPPVSVDAFSKGQGEFLWM
jgi:hypothetical protein